MESVSSILNETVPADSKDFDSKAEYKDKDGQELHAAAKMVALRPFSYCCLKDLTLIQRTGMVPLHRCGQLFMANKLLFRCCYKAALIHL